LRNQYARIGAAAVISATAREAGVYRKTFYALLKREKKPQAGE